MKTLALLALALSLSAAPAFAKFPGGQKLASVNQLTADAFGFSEMTETGNGCRLSVEKIQNGIRLVMESDEDGRIYLDAAYDGAVLLHERNDEDGSFVKEYELPGQGKLTAIFADDSFFHAKMEAQGKTISCEIDY